MKELKEFTIPFIGLKQGEHHFDYKINQKFFEHFEYDEFHNVDVEATALLLKKSNALEIDFTINGKVQVVCDLSNEPFDQTISGKHKLVVNFGEAYNDVDDTLLVIPHGSYEINIQQYIYELIILSVPAKRVHPGIKDGSLDSDILKKLEELKPNKTKDKTTNDTIDPRWDQLKKLLTDK